MEGRRETTQHWQPKWSDRLSMAAQVSQDTGCYEAKFFRRSGCGRLPSRLHTLRPVASGRELLRCKTVPVKQISAALLT